MAKKKASAVQALTIALIIFVMCTFVLAVTTYVFYAQNEDAKVAREAAETAAGEAQQSLAAAQQSQKELLETRIGVNEGDLIEAVDKAVVRKTQHPHTVNSSKHLTMRSKVRTVTTQA